MIPLFIFEKIQGTGITACKTSRVLGKAKSKKQGISRKSKKTTVDFKKKQENP